MAMARTARPSCPARWCWSAASCSRRRTTTCRSSSGSHRAGPEPALLRLRRGTPGRGGLRRAERPLRFAYDADWRDYPGNHFGPYTAGAPRLYLCNRLGYDIARSIELHGFRFMRARGSTTGGNIGFSLNTLSLLLEDVTIQETDPADERPLSTFVQMNDQVTLRRCRLRRSRDRQMPAPRGDRGLRDRG